MWAGMLLTAALGVPELAGDAYAHMPFIFHNWEIENESKQRLRKSERFVSWPVKTKKPLPSRIVENSRWFSFQIPVCPEILSGSSGSH